MGVVQKSANSTKALRDKTRRIARFHRWVILAIAIHIGTFVLITLIGLIGGQFQLLTTLAKTPFVNVVGYGLLIFQVAAMVLLAKELTIIEQPQVASRSLFSAGQACTRLPTRVTQIL